MWMGKRSRKCLEGSGKPRGPIVYLHHNQKHNDMACIISLIDPTKNKIVKTATVDENYAGAEKKVKQLNAKPNKKGSFWVVTTIGV